MGPVITNSDFFGRDFLKNDFVYLSERREPK